MEMVLFIGIQATGKSEFYKRHFYKTHMRINLDMLHTRHREDAFLAACLQTKQPFVVDNTNPSRADRQRYIEPARKAGFTVKGYYFRSSLQEAMVRNDRRAGKERLPKQALLSAHARLERPLMDEGFDSLYYVRIHDDGQFMVEDYTGEI